MSSNYRDLDIYKSSLNLFFQVHSLSLKLPKYEMYELGSQIRRSSDSVVTNIVEGYGRKRYKADFIKFLIYSHASNDETILHFNKLLHLYPSIMEPNRALMNEYEILVAKINKYIQYVELNWKS